MWYEDDSSPSDRRPADQPTSKGNLRTNGFVWGRKRVVLKLSLRDLGRLTGISHGILSLYENGRMIPTAIDFDKVWDVLQARTAS